MWGQWRITSSIVASTKCVFDRSSSVGLLSPMEDLRKKTVFAMLQLASLVLPYVFVELLLDFGKGHHV